MNDFYVTLVSTTSEENKLSDFTVQLPKPIDKIENYKVGLSSIHYYSNWVNVPKNHVFFIRFNR